MKNKPVVNLATPVKWEEKEYKELTFDINRIKGRDLIEIQTDMKLAGIPLTSSMFIDEAYLARVAAKASGVETEVIESLNFIDFRKVINEISGLML